MVKSFDALIVGAGQAGPALAERLTAAGQTVAIVERHLFGGTCVNTGCTPTKTLVASAHAAHLARRAAEYGVKIAGQVEIDMKAVKARKDAISAKSREGVEAWLRGMERCTVYQQHAHFESPHELRVGDDVLSARQTFLNVGGRAVVPDLPGIDQVHYLTNTSILELDVVPRHLAIVGGSYIGLEFAQMYRRFGSDVTILQKGPRLIPHEDEDVSDAIMGILEGEGIAVRLDTHSIRLQQHGADIAIAVNGGPELMASHLLLAVGRRPNTDDLGLNKTGIALDDKGFIIVDDQLQTSVPGIWALGDCNGRGAFTHSAYNDFEIVAANLLDGEDRRVSDRIPAYALYIDPPLGRVGLTEAEARNTGRKVLVGKRPMTKVARAVEKGETQGFIKIVVDGDTDMILGAAILGVGGDEAIHGILDTMAAKAPYTTLKRAMHIHPTVSELIPTVLGALEG